MSVGRTPASTGRWAVAGFAAAVGVLALLVIPLAVVSGAGSTVLRQTTLAAVVVAATSAVVCVVALDLLGAGARRRAGSSRGSVRNTPRRHERTHF